MNKGKRNKNKKNKGGQQQAQKVEKAESNGSWEEMLNKPLPEDAEAMSSKQAAAVVMAAATVAAEGKAVTMKMTTP